MSEPSVTRQRLEESWRRRLSEAQTHYQKAHNRYRRLLEEQQDGTPHDPNGFVALARQTESDALAEYTRVLREFTDPGAKGETPEECSTGSDGI